MKEIINAGNTNQSGHRPLLSDSEYEDSESRHHVDEAINRNNPVTTHNTLQSATQFYTTIGYGPVMIMAATTAIIAKAVGGACDSEARSPCFWAFALSPLAVQQMAKTKNRFPTIDQCIGEVSHIGAALATATMFSSELVAFQNVTGLCFSMHILTAVMLTAKHSQGASSLDETQYESLVNALSLLLAGATMIVGSVMNYKDNHSDSCDSFAFNVSNIILSSTVTLWGASMTGLHFSHNKPSRASYTEEHQQDQERGASTERLNR